MDIRSPGSPSRSPVLEAQLSMFLKVLHMLITPFVMVQYCDKIWSAGGFTFVSLVCMSALNIIGVELENPFGDDPNDLPANETHNDFRESLLTLTDPAVWRVPGLLPTAKLDFRQLQAANSTSLSRYLNGLDVLKEANAKEAKELEEIGEIDKMRDKTQETRGPGPGGPGGPGSGPEDPWVLEEWLRRQTALLENFLAKQNDMLEQHALAMRCASLPKAGKAKSDSAERYRRDIAGARCPPDMPSKSLNGERGGCCWGYHLGSFASLRWSEEVGDFRGEPLCFGARSKPRLRSLPRPRSKVSAAAACSRGGGGSQNEVAPRPKPQAKSQSEFV